MGTKGFVPNGLLRLFGVLRKLRYAGSAQGQRGSNGMTDASAVFETGLEPRPANYVPLSPLSFLTRAARVYGPRTAVIHGPRRYTYAEFDERCRRLASAVSHRGVGKGDTVAIMAPNIP